MSPGFSFDVPTGLTELMQDFVIAVLKAKPNNLIAFAADYFAERNAGGGAGNLVVAKSAGQNDDDDSDSSSSVLMEVEPPPRNFRRQSVAAESYDPEADEDDEEGHPVYPKTDEQRKRLTDICQNILLFRCLEEEDMEDVVNAMFERNADPGDKIMVQGEDGDNFYIIDSGAYDVFIKINNEDKKVHQFVDKGSFGELALMYNTPRSATITAVTCGTLWAMDRTTFRTIVLKKAFQKRLRYETLLESVPILKELSSYERMSIADALQTKVFEKDEIIMRQGDPGTEMFFIEEGEVRITRRTKTASGKFEEVLLSKLTTGNYFGELALITKQPRAASVIATGRCKAARLDVMSFERLLGPCIEVLKRNIDLYNSQLKKIEPGAIR